MTAEELRDLLALRGRPARVRGGEVQVEVCWFCGNERWNLEMNPAKGVWSCWACRAGGRLDELLRDRVGEDVRIPVRLDGDGAHGNVGALPPPEGLRSRPVEDVPSAERWLRRRGLPPDVAGRYGIRVCAEEAPHPMALRLLLPLRDFWTGDVLGHMGRSYVPGRPPKYRTTLPRRVLSGHRTREPRPCLVVEGPFDGIAVHRAGLQAAVLGGTDSPEEEELADRLPPEVPLAVLLDGSAREEARRLLHRLRAIRPSTGLLLLPPGVDPGELRPVVLQKLVEQRC